MAIAAQAEMMRVEEENILHALDPHTLHKGRQYYAEGRVAEMVTDDEGRRLWASVRGSRRQPYRVMVMLKPGSQALLRSRCSCPMQHDCKHVAAVLCATLENPGNQPRAAPLRDPLAGPAGAWLQRIAQAATPLALERVPACLLYILDVQVKGAKAELRISAQLSRPKKSGGFNKLRSHSIEHLLSSGLALEPEDQLIGRLARAGASSYPPGLPQDGPMMDLLLRRLVATGRCHWQDVATPLRQGSSRRGVIEWTLMADGRQQLVVAGGRRGLVVLPTAARWYVDAKSGEAGPLDLGYSAPMIDALLQAPSLSPAQASAMHGRLTGELASLGVPPPAADVVEDIRTEPPVPYLRLLTAADARSDWYAYGRKRAADPLIDVAVLNFIYDGAALKWQQAPDEQRRLEGRRVIVRRRDKLFEAAACERLKRLGLWPAGRLPKGVKGKDGMVLTPESGAFEWPAFLHRVLPALAADGWRIDIVEGFRPRVVEPTGDWQGALSDSGAWWFSLDLGIDVEGERLSLLPHLVRLLRKLPDPAAPEAIDGLTRDGVLYLPLDDGRHVALPVDRVRVILETLIELHDASALRDDGRLDVSLGHAAALAELEAALRLRWLGGERLRMMAQRLRSFSGIATVPAPDGFGAELRPYQRTGLDWLQFIREYELGGILADDMGLGKTVQALAHILVEKRAGRLTRPCLVICPTSVLPNWRAEAARFAPDLRVLTLHGAGRDERFGDIGAADLVLSTYALLPRDEAVLMPIDWHLVIADESQAIKNPAAKTTQLVCRLKARHRLSLTGTPIENHLGELWSQFAFLMPGLLGDSRRFSRVFRTPIEQHGDAHRRDLLSARLKPFILRRTKAGVAGELPPKSDILQRIELASDQRDLYEAVRLATHEKVRQEIAAKGLARSHIVILDALLKLRQVCCDPRLVKTSAARRVKSSAKLEHLLTMLPELIEEGRRILLFSQFTSMLDLIRPELADHDIAFVELRGDTRDRATPVARFQAGAVPLFLISLKAGGTGLNLTGADAVIHYDPWWNPAVENQATDRAHRIGQDKPVFVFKLIAQGTVEERIVELQQRKAALAAAMLDAERTGARSLAPEDLDLLFRPIE